MTDYQQPQPDRQLLDAVARLAGVRRVLVTGEALSGESGSAFAVTAGGDELVVKLVQGARRAMDNQRRLVRLVADLRQRGYPAPEYLGVGESGSAIFTVQRRMPGQVLHRGPGMPPAPELFAAVLPSLLAAIELQRDAGDLARPPWPAWLLDTIETGGDGYCLHDTMDQAPRTAALLRRLQALARRNRRDEVRTRDVVHFDMNPANILHAAGRLRAVVDWDIPFDGAGQGDRGFESLPCCSTPTTSTGRGRCCGNARCSSAASRGPRYTCATSAFDRWNGRDGIALAAPTTHGSWPSPKLCWTTARRKARDGLSTSSPR